MAIEIDIKSVPKLGSSKEAFQMAQAVAKESAKWQGKLMQGGPRFMFWSMKKARKAAHLNDYRRHGESIMPLPEILVNGQKFWAVRYGPPATVGRLQWIPTGYTIMKEDDSIVNDAQLALKTVRLYRLWDEIYLRPYKVPRTQTVIDWMMQFENKFYSDISERIESDYSSLDGTQEDHEILRELDRQVYDFHNARVEMLLLEKKLREIILDVCDHPSDSNIAEFVGLTYRFKELGREHREMVAKRLQTFTKYRAVLERDFHVKIDFEVDWKELSFAALFDLSKYLLWNHFIPEGVLTKASYDVLSSTIRAKILQRVLNLIVHAGGVDCLQRQLLANQAFLDAIERYLRIWEEPSAEYVRIP